MARVCICCC